LIIGTTLVALPHVACVQRASDNVTTQSSDAFGRSVGNEMSWFYATDDFRGFNPVDAGNVRLEGFYGLVTVLRRSLESLPLDRGDQREDQAYR
jgi:hypothetical protein